MEFHGISVDFHASKFPWKAWKYFRAFSMGMERIETTNKHGNSMEFPWNFHGAATSRARIGIGIPWNFHGISTEIVMSKNWNWNSMEFPWNFHGISVEIPWKFHGKMVKNTIRKLSQCPRAVDCS